MDKRWLPIIIILGIFVPKIFFHYQRTTLGEKYVEELQKEISGLHLISLYMRDQASQADFDLSSTSVSEIKSGDNLKELEALLSKVYCEQNISQLQKLKITYFHVNIYIEKHELILSRILSPKHCS